MVQIARLPDMGVGGGNPNYRIVNGVVVGVGVGTLFMAAPLAAPAARFGMMAASGLVPGGTELILFLNRLKVLRLGAVEMAGATVATGVGIWNAYRLRNEISAFAQDKYDWIINKANWTPDMEFGSLRVKPGMVQPSLSQRTRKSPRIGKRRRRCKFRNRKSGKTCLRPRGHSGRHRYR